MKKQLIIATVLSVIFISGCSYSPRQSDRVATVKNGDTKEHLIGTAGWPDKIVDVDRHTKEYIYVEKHWFGKGDTTQSVYVRDGKVYLLKNVDTSLKK